MFEVLILWAEATAVVGFGGGNHAACPAQDLTLNRRTAAEQLLAAARYQLVGELCLSS